MVLWKGQTDSLCPVEQLAACDPVVLWSYVAGLTLLPIMPSVGLEQFFSVFCLFFAFWFLVSSQLRPKSRSFLASFAFFMTPVPPS